MGGYAGADRCCRHHDLGCPISIEPGQTRYGLTNVRIHTVMHCSCDQRFRSCLKMARTQAADIVGNLFFNVADIPCFVFSKAKVTFKQKIFSSPGLLCPQLVGPLYFRTGETFSSLEETFTLLKLVKNGREVQERKT
eukprot:GFUD01117218.1.p1 GENE.GFUD01117218.1~~GFUD01117218.1.p1  ORF type:complete len:137 (-),score=27.94 GFUD01117218.1:100-510(-)